MKCDYIYIIAMFAGLTALVLGVMLAFIASPAETARRHHGDAWDLHGRITCEYCKRLTKGTSHEQH